MYYFNNIDYGRDLSKPIPGAPNFTYGEVVSSPSAIKLHIKNIPSEDQWKAAEALATNVLQPLREVFGPIRVNSWYRSPELNSSKLIGGSTTSNHCKGEAADIESATVPLLDILEYISLHLPHHELIAEYFPNGWVHVAYRVGSDRRKLKLKDKDHNYSVVNLNYIKSIYGK